MKRKNVTKLIQIFSIILLLRDLLIFYRKNRKTVHMLVNNVDKFFKRKRKA